MKRPPSSQLSAERWVYKRGAAPEDRYPHPFARSLSRIVLALMILLVLPLVAGLFLLDGPSLVLWMRNNAWIASWYSATLFTATEITLIVLLITILLPILGPLTREERRAMGDQLKDHAKRELELQEDD